MGICDCVTSYADSNSSSTMSNNHETIKISEKKEPTPTTPLDEKKARIQWSSPTEFLLTCIGYSVGLGNVWRFPYLCYKNGGGAFLIPYGLMIMFIGIPLLFMEYGFGQYFGIGSLSIFKQVCPLFQGIGIGYSILNGLVSIYYNIIIAISIYYIFYSLRSNLPWATCGHEWNTASCNELPEYDSNATYWNASDVASFYRNQTSSSFVYGENNSSLNATNAAAPFQRKSPSDEFFRLALMGEGANNDIGNLGSVQWKLCLCLFLSWILVAIFVSRGIKSSGKVAYFTATFPYVMLTVLVVKGVTLDGAIDGLLFFIVPKWDKLLSPDVWFNAATQLFYSLNLAWGGMITMSSYNQQTHNCFRDSVVINIVSFATSLYAGIAVFSIIGFMAKEYGLPIDKVIESGPGLAFVAYPRALSLMPIAPLWSLLFFFMLFLLGIGSQMVCVETIITGIMDNWSFLVRRWQYRVAAIFVVSLVGFLLGIPCTTQGGMYVLTLMDHFSAGFCVLIIAIFECVVINWIYGDVKFLSHVQWMIGERTHLSRVWTVFWKFISPLIILVILIFSFVRYSPVVYNNKVYPAWAEAIGWTMTLASNIPIFLVAVYMFYRAKGSTFMQKWRYAIKPKVDADVGEQRRKSEALNFNSVREIGHNSDGTFTASHFHQIEVCVPLNHMTTSPAEPV